MDGWNISGFIILDDHDVPGEMVLSKGDVVYTGMIKGALESFPVQGSPYPTNGLGFAFATKGGSSGWYPKAIARRYYPWMDDPIE